jgi:hypothetical protein
MTTRAMRTAIAMTKFGTLHGKWKDPKRVNGSIEFSRAVAWGADDIDTLAALSEDQFCAFFKSLRGDDLNTAVTGIVQFSRISNLGEKDRAICEVAALSRIGKESALNRRRVQKFGIKLD